MQKNIFLSIILGGFLFFELAPTFFPTSAHAGPGGQGMGVGPVCPPACPPNPANCDANLVITETQALQFGSIIAPTAGTVVIDTAGVRTATGGVVLIGAGGSAGNFSLSTAPYNCTGRVLKTITVGPSAALNHTTLPASLTVDTFTTNPPAGGAFDPTIPFTVGATLNVGTMPTPGTYIGTYILTITFQ